MNCIEIACQAAKSAAYAELQIGRHAEAYKKVVFRVHVYEDMLPVKLTIAKEELLDALYEGGFDPKTVTNADIDALEDKIQDSIIEIADNNTPVYTREIEQIMFDHGDEIERAFDDAGIGEKNDRDFPNGWKAAAVCTYIAQELREYLTAWIDEERDRLADRDAEETA